MTYNELYQEILLKKSYLCVGLDTDINKIPPYLLALEDPIFEFNKQIIESTAEYCVAYKPNIAFYESLGIKGWISLQKTISFLNTHYPKHFTIADAKRGDIGNTSYMYAKAFFEEFSFDSITISPYMGKDSITPFLEYKNKWAIVLALTSNEGSKDFEEISDTNGQKLYENVLKTTQNWANHEQMMYVTGATKAIEFKNIRKIVPKHFLLVPGVGAQGGNLEEVSKYGMNNHVGLLVNSSRAIIYASNSSDFALKASIEAQKVQKEMEIYLENIYNKL
ncbi:MAG: orotidine-5'-phosphate decarboxylase [Cytophagales bacterium]|nr:MAG: orotidine-5'-phosphate decarboxylase [Cytophagales bacterium]